MCDALIEIVCQTVCKLVIFNTAMVKLSQISDNVQHQNTKKKTSIIEAFSCLE